MPDNETGFPRKPRGTRKASASYADDWPDVTPAETSAAVHAPPERQRIAKAMARAGLCSRRDAEAWILAGRVSVNGAVLASPARDVGPDDHVEVDGAPLPTPDKTRLFLFHKPRGLVTSDHDPEGRQTIFDHLREHWPQGPRVVTVGRLDINTEGLLLLTNDGGLARMLELPKTGWLRRYRVRANGETDQAQLDALAAGLTIDGVDYAGIEAKLDRQQGANCWLTMGLREGKNREIKRVLEHLGLEVNRLIRLSFGPFQLLELEEGRVEEVRTRVLRDQLGTALAAEAGVDFGDAPAPDPELPKIVLKGGIRAKAPRETKAGDGAAPRGRTERAPRAPTGRNSDRSAERPQRRRETTQIEPREQSRPRRHVSTLRSAEAETGRSGPRKRIERTDTRDRHDRTVAVERKVAARPAGVSPSAEGKRARIARSGGGRRSETNERREGAPRRDGGRTAERGAPTRSRAPVDAAGERRDARFSRPRSEARPGGRREDGERAAPPRGRPAAGGERRDTKPPRTGGNERPRTPRQDDTRTAARNRSASGGERREGRGGGERDAAARGDRPERAGARPPRRSDPSGASAGKPRGANPRGAARDGETSRPRGAAPRGRPEGGKATGRNPGGRPPMGRGAGGKPPRGGDSGGRPPRGNAPGGKPPRGGTPGRTKR